MELQIVEDEDGLWGLALDGGPLRLKSEAMANDLAGHFLMVSELDLPIRVVRRDGTNEVFPTGPDAHGRKLKTVRRLDD